jgi:hypothetical protein
MPRASSAAFPGTLGAYVRPESSLGRYDDRDAAGSATVPPDPLLSVHRLASAPGRGLTAVRPDGYVGLRGQLADARQLTAWLRLLSPGRW